jgi:plastocyanin
MRRFAPRPRALEAGVMTRHVIRLVCPAIMAGALLAGCGGDPSAASPPSAGTTANAATIKNFAFSPSPLTVKTGTTVTWTNQDASTHTVTAVDKGFDSGDVAPSKAFTRTFSTAGTFAYRCNIHQYMTGSVVVQG